MLRHPLASTPPLADALLGSRSGFSHELRLSLLLNKAYRVWCWNHEELFGLRISAHAAETQTLHPIVNSQPAYSLTPPAAGEDKVCYAQWIDSNQRDSAVFAWAARSSVARQNDVSAKPLSPAHPVSDARSSTPGQKCTNACQMVSTPAQGDTVSTAHTPAKL